MMKLMEEKIVSRHKETKATSIWWKNKYYEGGINPAFLPLLLPIKKFSLIIDFFYDTILLPLNNFPFLFSLTIE